MSQIDDIKNKSVDKSLESLVDDKLQAEVNANTVFKKEDREKTIDTFIEKHESTYGKLRKKEKKLIENAEYDSTSGHIREITIGLAVVGIIVVVLLRNFLPNASLFALLVIIGATSFLPCGMILGWMLFDPVMRCKVIRKLSKRNYGIVNFVGHGNKTFPKIKNFDNALIWKENECWVIAKSRVMQMTKDGNAINNGKVIDEDSVLTYVDTVPVIFIDVHSMEPISISREGRTAVFPGEIGSSLKAWNDNQRAKMMAVKKMADSMLLIVIVACIGAVIISFLTMQKVEEMAETVEIMRSQLQSIVATSPQ